MLFWQKYLKKKKKEVIPKRKAFLESNKHPICNTRPCGLCPLTGSGYETVFWTLL